MTLNQKIVTTLSQRPDAVRVLHTVAEANTASLNELVHDTALSQEQVLNAIETLKKAQLVKATPSPIPRLATFYVTATGLQADRELESLRM
jgi:DNA-binding MarR family transcriptional regulator